MTSNSSIQRRPDPDSRNERLVDARSADLVLAALAVPPARDGGPGAGRGDDSRAGTRGERLPGRDGGRRHWRARSVA
jgi:hypothetical protein